jgi:hypothetical protein
MRAFYLGWEIWQTPSAKFEARVICPALLEEPAGRDAGKAASGGKIRTSSGQFSIVQTPSAKLDLIAFPGIFPLPWSHYVRLLAVEKPHARAFYESEAIRGGWSVRQLDRQISTQFFERSAHSKNPTAPVARGQKARPEDAVSLEDELRDPYFLEFLNLKMNTARTTWRRRWSGTWKTGSDQSCWKR